MICVQDYVEEIYQTYLLAHKDNKLEEELSNLIAVTPEPMNGMLEKQNREEAIHKRDTRQKIALEAKEVPPTTPCNCS